MFDQSRIRVASIIIMVGAVGLLTACEQRSEVAGTKRTESMSAPPSTSGAKEKMAAATDKAANEVDDIALTAKVKASLLAEPGLRSLPIHVETTKGAVTLSGTVDSDTARQRAKEVVKSIEGVATVVDALAVKS